MRRDKRDPHDLQLVGEILGKPVAVDPERPNTLGGATPVDRMDPKDFPLYRAQKDCRFCGRSYLGLSLLPQYDDDTAPQYGWCGCALKVTGGEGRWQRHGLRPQLAGSAPTRRTRDPLYD